VKIDIVKAIISLGGGGFSRRSFHIFCSNELNLGIRDLKIILSVENRHREGRIFLMNINETTCTCVHNAHGILTVKKHL